MCSRWQDMSLIKFGCLVPNVVFFNSSSARISNNGRVRVQLEVTLRQRAKHDCVTKVTEINSAMKL